VYRLPRPRNRIDVVGVVVLGFGFNFGFDFVVLDDTVGRDAATGSSATTGRVRVVSASSTSVTL